MNSRARKKMLSFHEEKARVLQREKIQNLENIPPPFHIMVFPRVLYMGRENQRQRQRERPRDRERERECQERCTLHTDRHPVVLHLLAIRIAVAYVIALPGGLLKVLVEETYDNYGCRNTIEN